MGRELLKTEPVFRQTIEACDAILAQHADWSLMDELTADEQRSRLHETAVAQPAIFALQEALTALWKSWGVEFDAVVGHSMGEIAAAHVAGALSLEEAVRVIFHRGRCMDLASSRGRMLAVGLSMTEAQDAIRGYEDRVALAAINGPTSATLSGDPSALETIAEGLESQGVFNQFLRVNYAFHSMQMDPVQGELLDALEGLDHLAPTGPIVSTVTGKPVEGRYLDAHYWWRNVRQSVLFAPAIDHLIAGGYDTFVEVSAHPVLSGSVAQCLAYRGQKGTVVPSLRRHEAERAMMLASLGALYTVGYPLDWRRWWRDGGHCVRLPTYPWQHRSYWHESTSLRAERLDSEAHPLLVRAKASADPSWEGVLDTRLLTYLRDHKIQDQVVFPGAGYVEMALAVARAHLGGEASVLDDLQFQKVLFLPENDAGPIIQTTY
jgi:acyl transferase domain-containing protein